VAADLGYGDVRALPGSVAWIDRLRTKAKRIAVVSEGERASSALEIAVARGGTTPERLRHAGAIAVLADLQELLGPTVG